MKHLMDKTGTKSLCGLMSYQIGDSRLFSNLKIGITCPVCKKAGNIPEYPYRPYKSKFLGE